MNDTPGKRHSSFIAKGAIRSVRSRSKRLAGRQKMRIQRLSNLALAVACALALVSTRAAALDTGPVNLNTASEKELEALPGVGEATAKKIVAGRPYSSVDDLAKAGVSKSTIDKLRSGASVSGAAAPQAAPAAAAAPASAPPAKAAPTAPSTPPATASAAPAAATPAAAAAPHASTSGSTAEVNKVAPGEKVNINTASLSDLERLPGIGPTKAQAIIDARPFTAPTDIMKAKGIKEGTYAKLKDNITVN